mmetsp:Transcript_26179/g.75076  ORF Transcript_26179/g.75076 Transcript_26179/m.75076 type:complete len:231 (+) Transcript_26179:1966-2658(+)
MTLPLAIFRRSTVRRMAVTFRNDACMRAMTCFSKTNICTTDRPYSLRFSPSVPGGRLILIFGGLAPDASNLLASLNDDQRSWSSTSLRSTAVSAAASFSQNAGVFWFECIEWMARNARAVQGRMSALTLKGLEDLRSHRPRTNAMKLIMNCFPLTSVRPSPLVIASHCAPLLCTIRRAAKVAAMLHRCRLWCCRKPSCASKLAWNSWYFMSNNIAGDVMRQNSSGGQKTT